MSDKCIIRKDRILIEGAKFGYAPNFSGSQLYLIRMAEFDRSQLSSPRKPKLRLSSRGSI